MLFLFENDQSYIVVNLFNTNMRSQIFDDCLPDAVCRLMSMLLHYITYLFQSVMLSLRVLCFRNAVCVQHNYISRI